MQDKLAWLNLGVMDTVKTSYNLRFKLDLCLLIQKGNDMIADDSTSELICSGISLHVSKACQKWRLFKSDRTL